ncbi:MAG: hypothetical protein NC095_11660 [Muribaculum sp.]|nr:hypothetical protein [Muribaculum sp.]
MFKKLFLYSAVAMMASAGLASCSQEEEPVGSLANPIDKDAVEWNLEMNLPDDMKTRAAASNEKGTDGLYSFTREINKIWYAVYYNDALLYDCTSAEAPQAVKNGDKFTMLFRMPKIYDPTKIKVFFWAGNSEDAVAISNNTSTTSGINLNFQNRCVSVDPKYLNGGNSTIAEYDSFAGYFQLSTTTNVTNYNLKVTLKRPFAQIHILSDEFTTPSVKAAYTNGITVVPGFGRYAATSSNIAQELVSPTTWFYDSSLSLNPSYKQHEYMFTQTNYEYVNNLADTWPTRTTFKERDFHYLGCYLVFAPNDASANIQGATATGNTAKYSKLNVAIRKTGDALSSSIFKAVDLPADGIRANNRYVVYNTKKTGNGDGDGGEGGGGFVSDSYAFEIVADNNWSGTSEIEHD